jgi:CubicO group peptidase (beta-lactamase class C family)
MSRGFSTDGLARFSDVAASHVSDDDVPGLVALTACGQQVHVDALGSLSIGGPPVRRDSLFRIASTTKPITAAATMVLVSEGLLSLDEPVDRLLPELANRQVLRRLDGPLDDTVPAHRPITVRDLLTFTFGFGMALAMFTAAEPWPVVVAANELRLGSFGPPEPAKFPDPDTWIAGLGSLPLMAQPGERWLYNTGAHVLGVLLARAAGMPIGEVLQTRLFEPLEMNDTSFWTPDVDRLATSYIPTPSGLAVWDKPDGAWSTPPAFGDGAAGLISTADDLLKFARMLLRDGGPVLSPDAVTQMTHPQLTSAQIAFGGLGADFFTDRSWGFGMAVTTEGPTAGSFGWDGGLGTSWLVDPARDLTLIVMTQRMFADSRTPAVHTELQEAARAAIA